MFQAAKIIKFDEEDKLLQISFLRKFIVFEDLLNHSKDIWYKVFQKTFTSNIQLSFDFKSAMEPTRKSIVSRDRVQPKAAVSHHTSMKKSLDLSDSMKWKLANELMKHFDGTISEISGEFYE